MLKLIFLLNRPLVLFKGLVGSENIDDTTNIVDRTKETFLLGFGKIQTALFYSLKDSAVIPISIKVVAE